MGDVMRAIVQDAYGSVDVPRLTEGAEPDIAENEALLNVRAAGMDRGTWHAMTGQPYLRTTSYRGKRDQMASA